MYLLWICVVIDGHGLSFVNQKNFARYFGTLRVNNNDSCNHAFKTDVYIVHKPYDEIVRA